MRRAQQRLWTPSPERQRPSDRMNICPKRFTVPTKLEVWRTLRLSQCNGNTIMNTNASVLLENIDLDEAAIGLGRAPLTGRLSSYSHRQVERLPGTITFLKATKVTPKASKSSAHGDMAQAAQIVAEWLTYLPRDCVNAMIERGWHRTAE